MKIFISWSGQTSNKIAGILHQWLPNVIQSVKPYYSPDDLTKGTRWNSEISKELSDCSLGIICLTKDNLNSSWIMFEAGALSKNLDDSKVCPILFGIAPSEIKGPLVQFQAAKFSKEEIRKVVRMINNETGERALSVEVFENTFEMWWPKLEDAINVTLKEKVSDSNFETRSDRDIIEEILQLSRVANIDKEKIFEDEYFLYPQFVTDLSHEYFAITSHFLKITGRNSAAERHIIYGLLQSLARRIGFIISCTKDFPINIKKEIEQTLRENEKMFDSLRRESLALLPDLS